MSLPYDVWLYIAKFIPEDALFRLLGVNSTFFDLVMNAKYREVKFNFADDVGTPRLVERLSDVTIANRVRSVCIGPHSHPRYPSSAQIYMVQRIAEVLPGCRGVTRCTIDCDWPAWLSDGMQPLLQVAWDTFGPGLQTLSLYPTPFSLHRLFVLAPPPALHNLTELDMRLSNSRPGDPGPLLGKDIILDELLPFIHLFRAKLKHLSLDLQIDNATCVPLLQGLHSFPELQQVELRSLFPFDEPTRGTAAAQFLQNQISLKRLVYRYHEYWQTTAAGVPLIAAPSFACIPEGGLPQLQSLTIDLLSCGETVRKAALCLRQVARTVSQLAFTSPWLVRESVQTLVNVFAESGARFTTLRLCVSSLTPEILDMLAHGLPHLRVLELMARVNIFSVAEQATSFCDAMRKRKYPNWALEYAVVVLQPEQLRDIPEARECARAIANSSALGTACGASDRSLDANYDYAVGYTTTHLYC